MKLQVFTHECSSHGGLLRAVRLLSKATLVLALALVLLPAISSWRGPVFVAEALQPTVIVTAENKTRDYGAPNPELTVTYSGFINNDGPENLFGTLTCTTTAEESSPAGDYPITCSGYSAHAYYDFIYESGTLTITKAPLTVTADDKGRTYGTPNPTFTASYSNFVLGQSASDLSGTLTLATTATNLSGVGSYPVTPSGLTSDNYDITYVDGNLTVGQATLSVKANDRTTIYGSANPVFTANYTGFVLNDDPSVLGGTLLFATTAVDASPVGFYPITTSGLTSPNYQISYDDYDMAHAKGMLQVLKAPLTVKAADTSKAFGEPNPAFTASYTGFVLGQDASVLGGALTFTTLATDSSVAGDYAVTPAGHTSTNYEITYMPGTLTITAPPTPENVPPIAVDDAAETQVGVPVTVVVLANDSDPDGDPLTVTHATSADGTTTVNMDGTITFAPSDGVSGTATIDYVISDGREGFDIAQVLVTIPAPPPSNLAVSPLPQTIPGNGTATSRITAVLTDHNGVPVSGVLVSFQTSAGELLAAVATTDVAGRAEVDLQSELLADLVSKDAVVIAQATDPWGYQLQAETMVTFVPVATTGTGTVPITINGMVTDRTTGMPVPGATVEISEDFDADGTEDFGATTTTDQDGRYVVEVPRGNWEYTPIISAPVQWGDRTITVRSRQKTQVGAAESLTESVPGDKMVSGQLFATSPADGNLVAPAQLFGNANVSGLLRPATGSGEERTFTIAADGSFGVDAVPVGQYTLLFRIELPNTDRLAGVTIPVTVAENGEINLTVGLIDPYGTVTDAVTNKVIEGANMQLFWADTALNRSHGRVPHTLVQLPELPDFPPNQNHVPQPSSSAGQYAWMVWADGDYYIFAGAVGYETYDSRVEGRTVPVKPGEDSYITDGIIHVGESVVNYDLQMQPLEVHGAYVKGYPDGTFRPGGLITRAEIAAIFARLSAPQKPLAFGPGFADVPESHWANEYTRLVRQLGLMSGDETGMFRPQAPITRGEMAQIAQRFGRLTVGGATPTDVVGHWAEQAIARTIASGVMVGYPDGTFRPNQPLTRAEAVTTINRLVGRKPLKGDRPQSWPDTPMSHWALEQIEEASRGHRFVRNEDGTERLLSELDLPTW